MLNRPRRDDEAGFSLVELLTVVVLIAVVGGIVTTTVVGGLGVSRRTEARAHALNDLQLGLERISREVRVAAPLKIETDVAERTWSLGADIVRDGERRTYTYYVEDESTDLREEVVRRTLQGNTVLGSTDRVFLSDIVNRAATTATTSVFTYLVLDPDTGELVPIDCTGLTDLECTNRTLTARQVQITLVRDLSEQEPVTVQTSVNVRNSRLRETVPTP